MGGVRSERDPARKVPSPAVLAVSSLLFETNQLCAFLCLLLQQSRRWIRFLGPPRQAITDPGEHDILLPVGPTLKPPGSARRRGNLDSSQSREWICYRSAEARLGSPISFAVN